MTGTLGLQGRRGRLLGIALLVVSGGPYPEGASRDTLTWLPASRSWTLLLESQQADGTWSTFASYTLAPRAVGASTQ
jgi:hypothetical protein